MNAIAVYYSTNDATNLDAKKVHMWGRSVCSELYFVSQGAERVLTGVLKESAKCEFSILKNRMRSNVRNWGGRLLRMSELSKEEYDKILPEVRVSAILQESELQKLRTSASSQDPQKPHQVEILPRNPGVPDDLPNASIADAIISIMGTTPTTAPGNAPSVPCSEVLKAMRPHVSSPASMILGNAKRRNPDFPPTFEVSLSGRFSPWTLTCDLTKVLILAIPHEELRKCLADPKIVDALSNLMAKTTSNASSIDANSSIKKLISDVEKNHQQNEKSLIQLPEISPDAGLFQCRVHIASDGVTALGSIFDVLKWLMVDKDDGKHNDWNKWLHHALKEEILQGAQDPFLILEHHHFNGNSTPMGNLGVLERAIRLCAVKSRITSDIVDTALALCTNSLAECPGIPQAVQAFLRRPAAQDPPEECRPNNHEQRMKDAELSYTQFLFTNKTKIAVREADEIHTRGVMEYNQKLARELVEYDEKRKRELVEYDEKRKRELVEYDEKRLENREERQSRQDKRQRESEIATLDQQNRTLQRNIETDAFQLKKARHDTEVRQAISDHSITPEEGALILSKPREIFRVSLATILSRHELSAVTNIKGFDQRFKRAYHDGEFSPKPISDWVNNNVNLRTGGVNWYTEDLPLILNFGKKLLAEASAVPEGQKTLTFVQKAAS
jgi:hypothetical protein